MHLLPAAIRCLSLVFPAMMIAQPAETADPFIWLEDVHSARALTWVRAQNALTQHELGASPDFKPVYDRLLAIYDSKARIPAVTKQGDFYYNFWRDAQHVRGLWRRTTLSEYRKESPAWETLLDLDALAAAEKENWVWKGSLWLRPDNARCLLNLSRGAVGLVSSGPPRLRRALRTRATHLPRGRHHHPRTPHPHGTG